VRNEGNKPKELEDHMKWRCCRVMRTELQTESQRLGGKAHMTLVMSVGCLERIDGEDVEGALHYM